MGFALFVARRYLLASRKQAIIFVISAISVVGVVVGVAALVVVLALMTGFQDQIQSKILGVNAHLTILSGFSGRPIEGAAALVDRVGHLPLVAAAAPVVYEKAMAASSLNAAGSAVLVKGIDPEAEARLTSLPTQVRGDLRALDRPDPSGRDAVFLGRDLAISLGVGPGDMVRLIVARVEVSPLLTVPRSREFLVAGTFETGFYEYDTARVYVGIRALRRFVGLEDDEATAVEARLRDTRRIPAAAARVQEMLGRDY